MDENLNGAPGADGKFGWVDESGPTGHSGYLPRNMNGYVPRNVDTVIETSGYLPGNRSGSNGNTYGHTSGTIGSMKIIQSKFKWTTTKILVIIIIILLLISTISIIKWRDNYVRANESIQLANSLSDTIVKTKNKLGQQVARISVLETESVKSFLKLRSNDSTILALQKLVKEYKDKLTNGSSATIIVVETKFDTIVKFDTAQYCNLNYKDDWIDLCVESIDSLSASIDLTVKNDFDVVIIADKKKPYVEVTTKNPYTDVKILRTYFNSKDIYTRKKFGLGLNAGIGVNYDLINKRPSIGVGISIGLNYNLINF